MVVMGLTGVGRKELFHRHLLLRSYHCLTRASCLLVRGVVAPPLISWGCNWRHKVGVFFVWLGKVLADFGFYDLS
jgi:hypothetical protein